MANDRTVIPATSKSRPPSKTNGTTKDTAPPPSPRSFNGFSEITSFLWGVADLLRGDYKQADYGKVIVTQDVIRLKLLAEYDAGYVARLLNSEYGRALVAQIKIESTRARVTLGEFKQLRVALPPHEEQRQIRCFVESATQKIDATTGLLVGQLSMLREYRQALITAAVTGKIDLSNEAA